MLITTKRNVGTEVRAVVQQKFTDLLNQQDVKVQRVGVGEAAYVEKNGNDQENVDEGNTNDNANLNPNPNPNNNDDGGDTGDAYEG